MPLQETIPETFGTGKLRGLVSAEHKDKDLLPKMGG